MKHSAVAGPVRPQPKPFQTLAVIGAGSWGTALAAVAARAGRNVRLWARDPALAASIAGQRRNTRYLPGIDLPPGITATADLEQAVRGADAVLLVVPSRAIRETARAIAPFLGKDVPVALCAKGIEAETGYLMGQVAATELDGTPVGAISGPTFAAETALAHPTAATVAFPFSYRDRIHPERATAVRMAVSMTTDTFRLYVSDDLVGVEVGGSVKNVIAIACGMMTGAGYAENTRAALITRGIDEMKTLAEALGGRRETVTGLSGAGDLTLTCSSTTSRNMSLGHQLGQGIARAACFEGRPVVVEGEHNAISVTDLARRLSLKMPICEAVRTILHDGADLGETFARLWAQPIEAEPNAMTLALDHPMNPDDIGSFAAAAGPDTKEDTV